MFNTLLQGNLLNVFVYYALDSYSELPVLRSTLSRPIDFLFVIICSLNNILIKFNYIFTYIKLSSH